MDPAQVIGVALLFGCLLFAEHAARAEGIEGAAEQLKAAKSSEQLDAVVHQVEQERHDLAARLGRLLRFSTSKAVKVRACFLAGQIHGFEAYDEMIANVDLESPTVEDAAWGRFPCQEALVKLGPRISRGLLDAVAKSANPSTQEHLVGVLISWYGAGKAAAVLDKARGEAQGEVAERLAKALKIVQAPAGTAVKPKG